jgi:hypothetical protein
MEDGEQRRAGRMLDFFYFLPAKRNDDRRVHIHVKCNKTIYLYVVGLKQRNSQHARNTGMMYERQGSNDVRRSLFPTLANEFDEQGN